jgi:hypothetical protein
MGEPAVKQDEKEPHRKRLNRKYAIIRFPGKLRKQDPDIISVGVNGDKYRMKRMEFIPVPASVIEALKNATEPVVEEEDPASPSVQTRRRKVVGFSPRFPFELHGYVTKDVYERARAIAKVRSITERELEEFLEE